MKMSRVSRVASWVVVLPVVLGCLGCATPEPVTAKDQAAVPGRETFVKGAKDAGVVRDNWLVEFRDPALPGLVAEAQKNNPDLSIASGRVDEARARAKRAGAVLSPQISAGAGVSAGDPGANRTASSQANLALSISWELDVWGRLRQGSQAAAQDALAAAADYEFARQSLATQTADAWFLAIAARRQAGLDRELLAIYEKTQEITQSRKAEGVASQMDVDLAAGNASNARQALARSEGAAEDAVRALEVVLGRYPSAELAVAPELPPMPGATPVGLPSELLERRPDVVAADRAVAAAFARTGSARAAKLPTFSISGSLGTLLNPAAAMWSLGGNLLAPVVDGGARQADVEIAEGQQKQSLGAYVRTAIRAFQEVETAMANEAVLAAREAELREASDRYGKARRSAEFSYREGAISLVDLNNIQSQDFATRGELLRVEAERLRQRLRLHLALGGSFSGK